MKNAKKVLERLERIAQKTKDRQEEIFKQVDTDDGDDSDAEELFDCDEEGAEEEGWEDDV